MPTDAAGDCYDAFIERVGVMAERDGLPRIAGRILGLLLVTPGALSIEDFATRLNVSRASVSTGARRLVELGKIERVGRPADRKDYYRLSPQHHLCAIREELGRTRDLLALLDEARTLPDMDPVVRERLDAAERLYAEMAETLGEALTRWRARPTPAAAVVAQPDAGATAALP